MSIQSKLKKCTGCSQLKHIWKSVGKKEKYCQHCWHSMEKPKSIPPVSKKRQVAMDEYSKKRNLFLITKPNCEARLQGCTGYSQDVHHKAGRVGDNYLNMSTWLATCRSCHHIIEMSPEMSKELGFSKSRLNY